MNLQKKLYKEFEKQNGIENVLEAIKNIAKDEYESCHGFETQKKIWDAIFWGVTKISDKLEKIKENDPKYLTG